MAFGDAARKRRANSRRRTLNLLHDVSGVKTVVQIGLGDWAEGPVLLGLFSPEDTTYFAIEPIQRYHEHAKDHGFPGEIHLGAAWFESGKTIKIYDQRTETSLIDNQMGKGPLGTITSTSVTLDSFKNKFTKPIFLWMDCEGAEPYVLKGAKEVLRQTKYILCELKDQPRSSGWMPSHKLISFLYDYGFFLIKRDEDGLFINKEWK